MPEARLPYRTLSSHPPRILVTGARGQVGFELQRALALQGQVTAVDRQACDLSDADAIRRCVRAVQPDLIVNAGAYTAVDKAESDQDTAYAINATAVRVLAEEARTLGAALMHYSTDYVFDGERDRPYREDDLTQPLNIYGASKLAGENAMAEVLGQQSPWWVIRTTWVYGLHGNNFLKTMLRLASQRGSLAVVADQIGAPTSAALIADISARFWQQQADSGLYHLAAGGETSWHGYAQHAIKRALAGGLKSTLNPETIQALTTADYPTPARRPANSRLNCDKLQRTLGLALPDWTLAVNQTTDLLMENRSS